MGKLVDIIGLTAGVLGTVGFVVYPITSLMIWGEKERLKDAVIERGDIDKDSKVSEDEWREVYRQLDLEYNFYKGSDLSLKDLRKYLSNTSN